MEDIVKKFQAAVEPVLKLAHERGLLIGGHFKVLVRTGGVFKPVTILNVTGSMMPAEFVEQAPEPKQLPTLEPTVKPAAPNITGDVCSKCGSGRMVRTGVCTTCLDCGESGGCG